MHWVATNFKRINHYKGGSVKSSGASLNRPVADDNEFVARLRQTVRCSLNRPVADDNEFVASNWRLPGHLENP